MLRSGDFSNREGELAVRGHVGAWHLEDADFAKRVAQGIGLLLGVGR